jgi:phosphoglycolate phosphatase-like HAD superfamily hydrolase
VAKFLKDNYKKYLFFIVSGTPTDELNKIVDERGLRKYFKEVLGIPGSKAEHSKMILEKYSLKQDEVIFIGDSPNDYTGAKEVGIKFISRIKHDENNPFESDDFEIKYSINNFTTLEDVIKTVNS